MYASKTSEIGSVESLTTEIKNVAGSTRLVIEPPFEARRYEFACPTDEALDASEPDEVPVLRRVLDTFEERLINVRSLPSVIKEYCIAQFGGVRSRTEWFSARGTITPASEERPDDPLQAIPTTIEGILDDALGENGQRIMTDGGRDIEVTEEDYGYLSAECPECGFEIWRSANPEDEEEPEHHGEDGVRAAVRSHLEHCGEFEPIKVRATGYVFSRIGEYQAGYQGTRSFRVQDAMRRQKTNLVMISPEEAEAVGESEEPVRWRDWSNVKEERESERLVTDGGYTFGGPKESNPERCPKCERLVSRYVNGNRCPFCGEETFEDDGEVLTDGGAASIEEPHPDDTGVEILTDGGSEVPERDEWRTLMGEYNPDEWNPEPNPDYYKSGSVSIHDRIEGEAYSEPGHWADRPADMDAENARRLALRGEFDDLDEHQPLPLISSSMRGVPTEGVQGSYSEVTELDEPCSECAQGWGILSVVTMAGVHQVKCLVCNHVIERG